jgi:hypothetical protein
MTDERKSWGLVRYIYLVAGVLVAIAAISSFISPGSVSPYIYVVAAVLTLAVALFGTDAWLERVHRVFWHRGRVK